MKFQKIPVVIDATQFVEEDIPGVYRDQSARPYVVTIHEQRCYIERGDWIVPEPDGVHFYPVKNDIFQKTYRWLPEGSINQALTVKVENDIFSISVGVNTLAFAIENANDDRLVPYDEASGEWLHPKVIDPTLFAEELAKALNTELYDGTIVSLLDDAAVYAIEGGAQGIIIAEDVHNV